MTQHTNDERLLWLLKTSRSLFASRDLERIMSLAVDALVEITGADRGYLFLTDLETGKLKLAAARGAGGLPLTAPEVRVTHVAQETLHERRTLVVEDSEQSTSRSIAELRVKMLVCAPILLEGETEGALYADGNTGQKPQMEARHVQILAEHVAVALENARLFERASNDLLTGLPNNTFFLAQLGKKMREATSEQAGGVLLLDLDAFKRINQAAGAEMGDRALIDIAHTLREVLRADGLVARYGSDKFAILLPPDGETPIGVRLRDVAERARAAIGTKAYHGVQLSASIGGIAFPVANAEGPSDVIAAADDVLAKARARGGGQVEIG